MFDLLLRRARLVDDTLTDIAIRDGKIAALGEISAPARKTLELDGRYYVSAGWIDSHVHCYPNSPIYHDEPDSVGVATGVTTVIDAGSTGADDVDDFYQLTRKAATEVYALLNISRVGLIAQNELTNMANIDAEAVKQVVNRYPNFIVGLKARMSSSVVGENGITPLARAKAIQQENGGLPLMVHIGNNPPDLDEIADLLTSGDIITHCYNGKPNRILTPSGELKSSISRALQRGVRLDIVPRHRQLQLRGGAAGDCYGHSAAHHQLRYLLPQPYRRPGAIAGAGDVEIPRHWHVAAAGH